MVIQPLGADDDARLAAFFAYWRAHVAENGDAITGWFQPLPRGTTLGDDRLAAFRDGLSKPLEGPGWRRAWVAVDDASGVILGHVDLRARPEPHASHRCLLGMGVHRDARRQGVGRRLLDHAMAWAAAQPGLDYMDLMVLQANASAVPLYLASGFVEDGRIDDHFRIDGEVLGSISMSRRV